MPLLKKIKLVLKISALVFSLYFIFVAILIYSFSFKNQLKKADVAIVLGAGVFGERPSPIFRERINHGIWLYKNKYVGKIIFTGGIGDKKLCSEAEVARNYAIEKGVLPADIYLEDKSKKTRENISFAKQIVRENKWSTIILVSDPLHMKRSMNIAEDNGLHAYTSPTPTTRIISFKNQVHFLAREVYFYVLYQLGK
jgi:uncharacterized SAM-binding protein YcdF (DUF218 family)